MTFIRRLQKINIEQLNAAYEAIESIIEKFYEPIKNATKDEKKQLYKERAKEFKNKLNEFKNIKGIIKALNSNYKEFVEDIICKEKSEGKISTVDNERANDLLLQHLAEISLKNPEFFSNFDDYRTKLEFLSGIMEEINSETNHKVLQYFDAFKQVTDNLKIKREFEELLKAKNQLNVETQKYANSLLAKKTFPTIKEDLEKLNVDPEFILKMISITHFSAFEREQKQNFDDLRNKLGKVSKRLENLHKKRKSIVVPNKRSVSFKMPRRNSFFVARSISLRNGLLNAGIKNTGKQNPIFQNLEYKANKLSEEIESHKIVIDKTERKQHIKQLKQLQLEKRIFANDSLTKIKSILMQRQISSSLQKSDINLIKCLINLTGSLINLNTLSSQKDIFEIGGKILQGLVGELDDEKDKPEISYKERVIQTAKIFDTLRQYYDALENFDKDSEIYKEKEKLFNIKVNDVKWLLEDLNNKNVCQEEDVNNTCNEITQATTLLINLSDLDSKHRENPDAQSVYTEGVKLAAIHLNRNHKEDIQFLNKAIDQTNKHLKDPSKPEKQNALIEIVNQAETRPSFKRLALSIGAVVLGSLLVGIGTATILLNTALAAITLPTIIGPIVAGAGIVGGVAMVTAGASMVYTGADGIHFFKTSFQEKRFANALSATIKPREKAAPEEDNVPKENVDDEIWPADQQKPVFK